MNDDTDDLTKEDLEAPLIGEDADVLPPPPIPEPKDNDLNDDFDRELPPTEDALNTHPATDTNVDPGALEYNGGNVADEVGASEPDADNAVVDYGPEKDDKQQQAA
ncbi:MAG: hypothetical protein M3Q14_00310 [bacterium]|nr:hypothetical protein [bacterium]